MVELALQVKGWLVLKQVHGLDKRVGRWVGMKCYNQCIYRGGVLCIDGVGGTMC